MRIAIVGNSGSGKSTLARHLALEHELSVLDLDTVAWEPGQIAVARPVELAVADIRKYCQARGSWIIEGCYAGLVDIVLDFDPKLIVLDPGVHICRENCLSRPWEPHKYSSKEEQDKGLEFLLNWVEEYYTRDGDMSLKAHRKLFEQYSGPKEWVTDLPPIDV